MPTDTVAARRPLHWGSMEQTRALRILIVDDDVSIRRGIERLLRLDLPTCVVAHACDGDAALKMAASRDCDVILLDISTPVKSGLETLRELRAGGEDASVIVISALPELHYRRAALAAGASEYLDQACVPEKLTALICDLVARKPLPATGAGSTPIRTA
jgi:DNA-binding NarL/FixJ family response regulator